MSGPEPATRRYGIVGWPLEHSLSPAIHSAAFRDLRLDASYERFPVRPGELRRALEDLRARGVAGLNVTMPHKEEALALSDEVAGVARRVGAVNTLVLEDRRIIGHNTDEQGFRAFLRDAGIDPRGRAALLLGAGGAARACALALVEVGLGSLIVVARRPEAAGAVAGLVAGAVETSAAGFDEAADVVGQADLVVNATPLGWRGERLPVRLGPGQVAVDLVYRDTPFLEESRRRGAEAHDGLGMLVRQAALSFEIWTGRAPSIEVMAAAAEAARGRTG